MMKAKDLFQKPRRTLRSEAVRIRREKEDPRQVKTPAAVRPPYSGRPAGSAQAHVPPVLVRNGSMGTPMADRTRQKARRRVDLPLNVPGVELRLPSLPVLHFTWRAISAGISLALTIILFVLFTSPNYQVRGAQIDGLQRLMPEEIFESLELKGQPVFVVDTRQMARDLQEIYPELSDIQIDVTLPANMTILVTERQPVLAWKQKDQTTWVDADGVGFAARSDDPSLVTINANDGPSQLANVDVMKGQFLPKEGIEAILKLSKLAPPNTPITYDALNGIGWQDSQGTQVFFGTDLEEMDVKMNIYQAIMTYSVQNGLMPAVINVAYTHAPYFRLEQ